MKEDVFMKCDIKSLARRALSLALCAVMALALVPAAQAAGVTAGLRTSGGTTLPKLSQQEIAQLLKDNPNTLPVSDIYDVVPSCTAPYSPGKVKDVVLQATLNRLNALRRLAGVPAVALDRSLCENAQYGAVLLAVSNFSHYPNKPADMDEAFFQTAQGATSSSNIYSGGAMTSRPDGFMDDSDGGNIDRLGHRRWQLNPSMGKIGFGTASRTGGNSGPMTEKVFDSSGAGCDYDFIGWPASGNFPSSLFGKNVAWSVTVNPQKYQTPNQSQLKVTLTRKTDGQTWTFSGSNYTAANSGAYFNVDTDGYGVANCIIFRPDGITSYQGTYSVKIDGLKTKSGQAVTDFEYEVEFFDVNAPAASIAYANTQTVLLDGKRVEFQTYALKDSAGGVTNYIKLRDMACYLNGTRAQFSVDWSAAQGISLTTGKPYTPNGSELSTPFSGNRAYKAGTGKTTINSAAYSIPTIILADDNGGAYTYYKLRDMGQYLGFNVSYINGQVVVNTNEPYSDAQ